MRRITPVAIGFAVLLSGGPAAALPPLPPVAGLLDVCYSATVAEAAAKGGRLGWERMDEARLASWRAGFERGGRTVDVVGWFRGPREEDGLLSFWTMPAPDGQRVCSYSVGQAAGLLDGLSHALGAPGRAEAAGEVNMAGWTRAAGEVSFVQVGAAALITVTHLP